MQFVQLNKSRHTIIDRANQCKGGQERVSQLTCLVDLLNILLVLFMRIVPTISCLSCLLCQRRNDSKFYRVCEMSFGQTEWTNTLSMHHVVRLYQRLSTGQSSCRCVGLVMTRRVFACELARGVNYESRAPDPNTRRLVEEGTEWQTNVRGGHEQRAAIRSGLLVLSYDS